MSLYAQDFLLDPKEVWFNVASEGPLPKNANKALQESIIWKSSPHLLTIPKFQSIPLVLKNALARLINVQSTDVILGNSATYGLHLLANGLDFKQADEIILLQNDFPTDILPWLSLETKGVCIHQLKAKKHVLTLEEIKNAINSKTKLICLPMVHSFTGYKEDIEAIGKLCQTHGIISVVNISQSAGVMPIDLSVLGVDAVVCAGYKWLLGPYGTGFCWIKKELRELLDYPQNYWISLMDEQSLNSEDTLVLKDVHSARRYDVFGTANFFNFVPWTASIEYLLSIGMQTIFNHNQHLVDSFIDGLNQDSYELISPALKLQRSNIVVFSHRDQSRNADLFNFLKNASFHLALWKNNLRFSPHIYNNQNQVQGLLKALDQYASQ